jgi:NADP-dependent alcohol dehydrogenase
MWEMRKEKFAKIKQYGERIWNIPVNNDEDVKKVIAVTSKFFVEMGLPVTFKDYNIGPEVVSKVTQRFERRGFEPMGETQSVTLKKMEAVLSGALT